MGLAEMVMLEEDESGLPRIPEDEAVLVARRMAEHERGLAREAVWELQDLLSSYTNLALEMGTDPSRVRAWVSKVRAFALKQGAK